MCHSYQLCWCHSRPLSRRWSSFDSIFQCPRSCLLYIWRPHARGDLNALSLGIWAADNGRENIQTFNDDTRGRSMYPLGPQLVFVPYVDESNVSFWRLVWLTQNDRDRRVSDLRRFSNEVNRVGISFKIAIYSNSSATWCCVEIWWRCGRVGDWQKRGGEKERTSIYLNGVRKRQK